MARNLNNLSLADHDAAKRISDTVTLHFTVATDIFDVADKWCAFKLANGETDGALYPTKIAAIDRQKGNPKDYCYLKITPDGITVKDAFLYLRINRHPMVDTTAPEEIIGPQIFPRFSNLTAAQRQALKAEAERQYRATQ